MALPVEIESSIPGSYFYVIQATSEHAEGCQIIMTIVLHYSYISSCLHICFASFYPYMYIKEQPQALIYQIH